MTRRLTQPAPQEPFKQLNKIAPPTKEYRRIQQYPATPSDTICWGDELTSCWGLVQQSFQKASQTPLERGSFLLHQGACLVSAHWHLQAYGASDMFTIRHTFHLDSRPHWSKQVCSSTCQLLTDAEAKFSDVPSCVVEYFVQVTDLVGEVWSISNCKGCGLRAADDVWAEGMASFGLLLTVTDWSTEAFPILFVQLLVPSSSWTKPEAAIQYR